MSWTMCECGDDVWCVDRDDGTITSVTWCGDSPTEIAVSVILARACDGNLVGIGYDNLLMTLPDEDVAGLVRSVRDPDETLVDGDWFDAVRVGCLTQVSATATNLDELCQALLSDADVVARILRAMPGYELCVTIDGYGKRDMCDAAYQDLFGPDDARRAARVIGDLDVVGELVTSGSIGITHADGARVDVSLWHEDEATGDIDELVLCEQMWGWDEEHDFVRQVYDGLLLRAGSDMDACDVRASSTDELDEWMRTIDWDFDRLDRVRARHEVDCARGDDERVVAALSWASDMCDVIDGRYPRVVGGKGR